MTGLITLLRQLIRSVHRRVIRMSLVRVGCCIVVRLWIEERSGLTVVTWLWPCLIKISLLMFN